MVAAVEPAAEVKEVAGVEIPAGMTVRFFDAAIQRSFDKDLKVKSLGNGKYAMQSSRDANRVYITTAHSCGCEGFQKYHRCYHQCRAAFEDAFNGPEPSAPATVPTLPDADNYVVVHYQDGRVGLQWLERRNGITRQVGLDVYGSTADADAAIRRYHRRRQRGPVHAVECPVCDGWGCDRHGLVCQHCQGRGYLMERVPTVAELVAAGRWPGQDVEQAA